MVVDIMSLESQSGLHFICINKQLNPAAFTSVESYLDMWNMYAEI